MSTLDFEQVDRPVAGGVARIVRVRGSIDSSSVARFDSVLSEIASAAPPLAVIECSGLEYINSRGMALLVRYHDTAKACGGGLVIAGLPGKIASLFETVGLDSTFVFARDEEDGVRRLEAAPASQGASSGGSVLRFSCEGCAAELTAASPGKYRCPRCQVCFEVSEKGRVAAFSARGARSVEITFPCRAAYVDAVRSAAESVAKDLELPAIPTEILDRAVDEGLGLFASKAGDGAVRIRMFVAADERQFSLAFLVSDQMLALTDEDEQGLTYRALRGMVDEISIIPLPPEGQILKLVKSFER